MPLMRDAPVHTVKEAERFPDKTPVTMTGTVEKVFEPRDFGYGEQVFFTFKDEEGSFFACTVKPPKEGLQPGRTFWAGQGDRGGAKLNRYTDKEGKQRTAINCPAACLVFTDDEYQPAAAPPESESPWQQPATPTIVTAPSATQRRYIPVDVPTTPAAKGKMTPDELFEAQLHYFQSWYQYLTSMHAKIPEPTRAELAEKLAVSICIAMVDGKVTRDIGPGPTQEQIDDPDSGVPF